MAKNVIITHKELDTIRSLEDFDLTMFLNELREYGWEAANAIIADIASAKDLRRKRREATINYVV